MQYVASPYSHKDKSIEHQRYLAVTNFCLQAVRQGIFVYSPIAHWHPIATYGDLPGDAAFWDKFNMTMLRRADGMLVLQLPGWQESKGVQRELSIAEILHIPVMYCTYTSLPNAHNQHSNA